MSVVEKQNALEKRKRIFGNTLAFYGVVEEHQKKTLHTHICAWGGLSPELLQKYSNVQHICDQISSTMDRMYTAKLNNDIIVTNTVRNVLRKHGSKFSWNPRETPMLFKNIQSWESANNNNEQSNEQKAYSYDHINDNIQFQAAIQQWHTHTFTCKKGFNGHTGCRLCKPSGLSNGTKPYLLTYKEIENIDN